MGLFGKLNFWKKEDDFSDLGLDKGMDSFGGDAPSADPLADPSAGGFGDTGPAPQTTAPSGIGADQTDFSLDTPDKSFQTAPQPQSPAPQSDVDSYRISKEIEVISSKLDALRASMESINQRLANIERMAETPDKRRHW
ncbi:hypothetical protein HQ529_04805 [Candidatus Woesearchaeota archaeon]|nr:hypothetical protein [Candidatus Woesearchaeota archaeon]